MSRASWLTAGSWLLLFWLYAGAVWVPALQRELEKRAAESLADLHTGHPPVVVQFSGQQAHISGKVRREEQRKDILHRISSTLTREGLLDFSLNPVTTVEDRIQVSPYPQGWLLLAVQGPQAMLYGSLATDQEARDLAGLLQERWSQTGGRLTPRLTVDSGRFDEAPDVQLTLDGMPGPLKGEGRDSIAAYLARAGSEWQRLDLESQADLLQTQVETYALSEAEWKVTVKPALDHLRKVKAEAQQRLAEAERQSRLAPPHVFLAARDNRLLVRGEVATLKIKRELLNTLIGTFPEWRVLDDLRVNDQRRAVDDFGPITTALLPDAESADGRSLRLGWAGAAWQPLDWEGENLSEMWQEKLPHGLPVSLLQQDHQMVTQWLRGSSQGIPSLPALAQPSFLTLALLPDKVILAGQLAEEPLRSRLVEAVRKTYGSRTVLLTEALLSRGTCQPTADVEQTARSLPPLPRADEPPVMAFAIPGEVWKSLPATPPLLEAGALATSGLLPSGFPSAMAEDTFAAEAYDHIRHHWQQAAPSANTR